MPPVFVNVTVFLVIFILSEWLFAVTQEGSLYIHYRKRDKWAGFWCAVSSIKLYQIVTNWRGLQILHWSDFSVSCPHGAIKARLSRDPISQIQTQTKGWPLTQFVRLMQDCLDGTAATLLLWLDESWGYFHPKGHQCCVSITDAGLWMQREH